MKKIDQFVHTLQYGDAISGEVLSIQRLLRELGHQSEIYALNVHEKLKDIPKKMSEFDANSPRDGMILHYSIGSPQNQAYLDSKDCKKIIIYHNLTPEHWFQSYNYTVTKNLIEGQGEIPTLLNFSDIILADSSFNAEELKKYTDKKISVLPLMIDPVRWNHSPNSGIISALKASKGINLLHVGRTAPNKCIEDIIKSFYFYHHKFNKNSRLWLVGHDIDTEIYSFELRSLVEELRLKECVNFVGSVSDDELTAFYQSSDAYICMSEHEGFCIPLIEALHFNLPVIAFESSAIKETLGEAGILIKEKDPLKTALILKKLLTSKDIRDSYLKQKSKQLEKFSLKTFKANLNKEIIEKLS